VRNRIEQERQVADRRGEASGLPTYYQSHGTTRVYNDPSPFATTDNIPPHPSEPALPTTVVQPRKIFGFILPKWPQWLGKLHLGRNANSETRVAEEVPPPDYLPPPPKYEDANPPRAAGQEPEESIEMSSRLAGSGTTTSDNATRRLEDQEAV